MKPGKPLTFAEILPRSSDRTSSKILAFGLPGNPVSCLVCFHLFVVPAIRQLSGWANPHLPRLPRVDRRSPLLSLSLNPFSIQFLVDLWLSNLSKAVSISNNCRVQARLKHSIKTDPHRSEFHRAVISWQLNDGSDYQG